MASIELLRNANVQDSCTKEKRLRLLAKRAGDLEIKAMTEGNRGRARHFMQRMYRLLNVLASLREEEEASRG